MQFVYRESRAASRVAWTSYVSYAVVAFAALVYLAQVYRHYRIQWDDGYITFRFAQHLAEGQGLVWNIGGERVEGFTSLLHVLLLALAMRLGAPPEAGSILISVVAVLATVAMLVMILRRHVGGLSVGAALVLGLYLVDETTAIHSTSGLETQLFVALLCVAYLIALAFIDAERRRPWLAVALAVATFLSVLGRPEGVIYGAAVYAVLAVYGLTRPRQFRRDYLASLALSAGLVALFGLVYATWKVQYFGYLLPNPYYVKSGQFGLRGIVDVLLFVAHLALWYGPLMLILAIVARGQGEMRWPADPERRAKVLLTLTPPLLALAYYLTIIHEMGVFYRFSYPTYFYFVVAMAAFATLALRHFQPFRIPRLIQVGLPLLCLTLPILSQGNWSLAPLPPDDLSEHYHLRIAEALASTGLGAQGTVLCDAAGVIPYVSGFNHIDRVGLADNYLSGRRPLTLAEREAYLWSRNADVYIGYEPPASVGALGPNDDPRMVSPYVDGVLMKMPLVGVTNRMYVQEPGLLHGRMRELRDNWIWVGEMDWPGQQVWQLKAFLYVRKASPHVDILLPALQGITDIPPGQVDLNAVAERQRTLSTAARLASSLAQAGLPVDQILAYFGVVR